MLCSFMFQMILFDGKKKLKRGEQDQGWWKYVVQHWTELWTHLVQCWARNTDITLTGSQKYADH